MSDDSLNASQLRGLYRRGGRKKDEDLTASQLQARYGMPKRRKGWGKEAPKTAMRSDLFIKAVILLVRQH